MNTGNIRFALPMDHLSLVEEGCFGFNLIAYGGRAWTVKMAVGRWTLVTLKRWSIG